VVVDEPILDASTGTHGPRPRGPVPFPGPDRVGPPLTTRRRAHRTRGHGGAGHARGVGRPTAPADGGAPERDVQRGSESTPLLLADPNPGPHRRCPQGEEPALDRSLSIG
jgi:hypothetical protein